MLRNVMHHRGFVKKIGQQLIVGKYGTSSICSLRTICEILPRFYHVFAETCNCRILFFSVSDYINQREIINRLPGRVAQSVGHLTRKSGVLGSIPGLATYFHVSFRFFKKGSCQLLAKVCAQSTG